MRFKLGDRVRVTGISRKSHTSNNETVWEESLLPTPEEGIIVGHRVMKSGEIKTYTEDSELFQSYTVTTFYTARQLNLTRCICWPLDITTHSML